MTASTKVSIRFSKSELAEITAWQEENCISSLSEAIRQLALQNVRGKHDETAVLLGEFREMENRTMRTFHKGTKASLGNTVALSTYLPAMANVINACYNVMVNVAAREELSIASDGTVERDMAVLSEWRGRTAQDFFKFVSDSGGVLSKAGAEQKYPYEARARFLKGTQKLPAMPSIAERATSESWITRTLGENFAKEWERSRELKLQRMRAISDLAAKGESAYGLVSSMWTEQEERHKELEATILAAAEEDIEMHHTGLVLDLECPEIWREPTQDEIAEREKCVLDILHSYGLSDTAVSEIMG